jgi:hypothetical protein
VDCDWGGVLLLFGRQEEVYGTDSGIGRIDCLFYLSSRRRSIHRIVIIVIIGAFTN